MDSAHLYLRFGQAIQSLRKKLGITQDDVAKRVGLSRTSVTNIEKGRQKVLLHQVFDFAECLQVTPEALLSTLNPAPTSIETKNLVLPKGIAADEKVWLSGLMRPSTSK